MEVMEVIKTRPLAKSVDISPCPFCNDNGSLYTQWEERQGYSPQSGTVVVRCRNCGASGPVTHWGHGFCLTSEEGDRDAILAWNHREGPLHPRQALMAAAWVRILLRRLA